MYKWYAWQISPWFPILGKAFFFVYVDKLGGLDLVSGVAQQAMQFCI